MGTSLEGISVIMPTYNQSRFIRRAIVSLMNQTHQKWELIIINDGSSDNTCSIVSDFLENRNVTYLENAFNEGLGKALNIGLAKAKYSFISYLPSDDLYFKDHLSSLLKNLKENSNDILSFSGVQCSALAPAGSLGIINGYPLQLVQVLHKRNSEKWMERSEMVTDNLNQMFWERLLEHGDGVGTGEITCEWVDHSAQRHKIINDRLGGGIFLYKKFYGVKYPIRFQSSGGNFIDEIEYFKPFRKSIQSLEKNEHALKIVIVGELAYNPERIFGLEQRGHKLYGLWIQNPANYNSIGPLPFGNVEDIGNENWKDRIKEINPDLIYGLLNYQAVPLAHEVLIHNPEIPFVWHLQESPFHCRQNGTWNMLVDLQLNSDAQIYINEIVRDWFLQFLPSTGLSFILDGELPKKEWFVDDRSELLSNIDGEIHTVCVGRLLGLQLSDLQALIEQKIHLHLYGEIFQTAYRDLLQKAQEIDGRYIHLHPFCSQENWVKEFSKYDAGWLHCFSSQNCGELLRASWNDLNTPARLSTYAMAGLPMIQVDNTGHLVASQSIIRKHELGFFFNSYEQLNELLSNKESVQKIRSNVWAKRHLFCFDNYLEDLENFFRMVIKNKSK